MSWLSRGKDRKVLSELVKVTVKVEDSNTGNRGIGHVILDDTENLPSKGDKEIVDTSLTTTEWYAGDEDHKTVQVLGIERQYRPTAEEELLLRRGGVANSWFDLEKVNYTDGYVSPDYEAVPTISSRVAKVGARKGLSWQERVGLAKSLVGNAKYGSPKYDRNAAIILSQHAGPRMRTETRTKLEQLTQSSDLETRRIAENALSGIRYHKF